MTAPRNEIWVQLRAGNYLYALEVLISQKATWTERNWRDFATLGTTYLCLRDYERASGAYRQANELYRMVHRAGAGPFNDDLAGSLWLAKHKDDAVLLWSETVDAIVGRKAERTDMSGGVRAGLLLWYGGVSKADPSVLSRSKAALKKIGNNRHAGTMPGPMAKVALGTTAVREVLEEKWSETDLPILLQRAKTDMLLRRDLCSVLFFWATAEREAGDEHKCRRIMSICNEIENPVIEIVWYLARGEVDSTAQVS